MAAALEIGVKAAFDLHIYSFGGKMYIQKSGDPTGKRVTCPSAKIRINQWYRKVKQILLKLDLDIPLCFVYVDDFRVGMTPIPYGYEWEHKTQKWTYSKELADTEEQTLTPEQKTSSALLQVMNGLYRDLVFTVESQEQFEDQHLPTLDCKLKLVNRPDGSASHITYS